MHVAGCIGNLLAALACLTLAFSASPARAADAANVYDAIQGYQSADADSDVVNSAITARIKRFMADLLYPVDLSVLDRPEKDSRFRQQIMALQKQMGVPATGLLTIEQFGRLEKAARELEADDNERRFNERLGKIAKAKVPETTTNRNSKRDRKDPK